MFLNKLSSSFLNKILLLLAVIAHSLQTTDDSDFDTFQENTVFSWRENSPLPLAFKWKKNCPRFSDNRVRNAGATQPKLGLSCFNTHMLFINSKIFSTTQPPTIFLFYSRPPVNTHLKKSLLRSTSLNVILQNTMVF